MRAREFIADLCQGADLVTQTKLAEFLLVQPDKIEEIKKLESGVNWERRTLDGWYILNHEKWTEFFYKERGAELWGHSFPSEAHAIAWAYYEKWL